MHIMNFSIFLVLTVKLCNSKTWTLQNSSRQTVSEFPILFVNGESEHYDVHVCLWKDFHVFIIEKFSYRMQWETQGRYCWGSRSKHQQYFQCQGAAFHFYKDATVEKIVVRMACHTEMLLVKFNKTSWWNWCKEFRPGILTLNSSMYDLPIGWIRLFLNDSLTY